MSDAQHCLADEILRQISLILALLDKLVDHCERCHKNEQRG